MLLNLSNHPSARWQAVQLQAAAAWGEVVDLPFPVVPPEADEAEVMAMARAVLGGLEARLRAAPAGEGHAVHLMGEFSLVASIWYLARGARPPLDRVTWLVSTTERVAEVQPDGTKRSTFTFVRFREVPVR